MKEENIIIESNCDSLPIYVTIFTPDDDNVNGIVQISHGMSEHKERYYNFMKYLTSEGYVTIINDHRGHGKSVKSKEDLGYFYDNKSNYIVEDLHQITMYIKDKYPNKDLILFGHSMGSMVVRKYIKKYDNDIYKLIVCGSPSKNPFTRLGLFFTKIVKCIKGKKHRSKAIQKMAFGSYNKLVEKPVSENAWVCSNEDTVQKYDKDDLCGFIFTTNGFENLFTLMLDIYNKNGWKLNNKELPILFIAGSNDPVIISKEKWEESQKFLKDLGYKNVSGKLYDGLRHEILNEKNQEEVYKDILEFIKR